MAAESDLLGVMVIAAWAVHSETAKGMKYSASRYLAYLMRNPQKVSKPCRVHTANILRAPYEQRRKTKTLLNYFNRVFNLVARAGFEPTTFGL